MKTIKSDLKDIQDLPLAQGRAHLIVWIVHIVRVQASCDRYPFGAFQGSFEILFLGAFWRIKRTLPPARPRTGRTCCAGTPWEGGMPVTLSTLPQVGPQHHRNSRKYLHQFIAHYSLIRFLIESSKHKISFSPRFKYFGRYLTLYHGMISIFF